jgi:hypothetical protein
MRTTGRSGNPFSHISIDKLVIKPPDHGDRIWTMLGSRMASLGACRF